MNLNFIAYGCGAAGVFIFPRAVIIAFDCYISALFGNKAIGFSAADSNHTRFGFILRIFFFYIADNILIFRLRKKLPAISGCRIFGQLYGCGFAGGKDDGFAALLLSKS